MRGEPGERERQALAGRDRCRADAREVLALQLDAAVDPNRVRADHRQPHVVLPLQPGNGRPVLEPQHQLGRDLHLALQALDDPCQDGVVPFGRHEVDESEGAVIRLEDRLEHERLGQVAALDALRLARRRDQPAAVLGTTEQGGEAGGRVEPGEAQPVDGARARDERGRAEIAEERVVLDRRARAPDGGQSQSCQRNRSHAHSLFFTPQVRQSQYSHQIQRRCWTSRTIIETMANRSSPGLTRGQHCTPPRGPQSTPPGRARSSLARKQLAVQIQVRGRGGGPR